MNITNPTKVALLIAHYNNGDFFEDCYRSIKSQNCKGLEIIIVDDCSTDGSFEKVKRLTENDRQVKLYQNDSNKGVGFTKKKCVDLAEAELCAFIDPDDKLADNAVETVLRRFEKVGEEVSAMYSRYYMCDENLNIKKVFERSRQIKNNSNLFVNIRLKVNHFFVFRRSAYLKTAAINPRLSSAVDQDLYLKLYETGEFLFINKILYYYRLHDKGISQNTDKKRSLRLNWHKVLQDTFRRRDIITLYNKPVDMVEDLPEFVYKNTYTSTMKIKNYFLHFYTRLSSQYYISYQR